MAVQKSGKIRDKATLRQQLYMSDSQDIIRGR